MGQGLTQTAKAQGSGGVAVVLVLPLIGLSEADLLGAR